MSVTSAARDLIEVRYNIASSRHPSARQKERDRVAQSAGGRPFVDAATSISVDEARSVQHPRQSLFRKDIIADFDRLESLVGWAKARSCAPCPPSRGLWWARGACHRAGRRPDPLALPTLRAIPRDRNRHQPDSTRLTAFGPLPFLSGSISNVIRCPSLRSFSPACSTAVICTNTS